MTMIEELMDFYTMPDFDRVRSFFDGMQFQDAVHFVSKHGITYIPTREFVDTLAEEIKDLDINGTILEICAGTGRLAYHLRQRGIDIYPTDSMVSGLKCPAGIVEKLTHEEGLRKYSPETVLASWLPYQSTIEIDVWKHPSVRQFILIGAGEGGPTGAEKHTNGTTIYDLAEPVKLPRSSVYGMFWASDTAHTIVELFRK